jgi:GntR family transcriptional regulator
VREALRRLRASGAVSAARGQPSRVRPATEIEQPLGALYSLFAAVRAAGLAQRSVVRFLDVRTDAAVAGRLGCERAEQFVYLERLRLAGSEPLALDRAWLVARVARPLLHADFRHTALYDELAGRCAVRVSGGREQLRAVVPTPADRALLGIGPRIGAFAIDRLGCADGMPVEWRHTVIRGDRFSVTAQFSDPDGYRVDLSGAHSVG